MAFLESDLDDLYGDLKSISLKIKTAKYNRSGTVGIGLVVEHILEHIEAVGPAMRQVAELREDQP